MSDTVLHLANRAKNIKSTPAYQPYSKVVIIVGNDSDGSQLIYEAGDDSARTLEITNPYGTQEMANSILSKLSGFEYKPYQADGALLNPAAELGDGITFSGDIYSFISATETVLSPIMSSTVAANEDGEIDHEYPYETKETKEVSRKISGLRTDFIVELGHVESRIFEKYETKTDATSKYTRINQTIDDIVLEASKTYETKTDAGVMQEKLTASIGMSAKNIKSTVAEAAIKYDTTGLTIDLYGYGTPADMGYNASDYNGKKYLDTSTGYYYTSNRTNWTKSSSPLQTVDSKLESSITQTASSITSTVASSTSKYDLSELPSGVSISYYGYGAPTISASGKKNKYYLDQSNGFYYKSNGTSWTKQNNTALPLITDTLSSTITQTASSISAKVNGIYAEEWEEGTGKGSDYYYNPGDVVKVTDGSTVTYYKCTYKNDSKPSNKPGSGAYWDEYWEETTPTSVQSMIDVGLNGITLGYKASSSANSATITLNKNGIQMQAQTITMTNVVADTIKAETSISSPKLYNLDGDVWLEMMNGRSYTGAGAGFSLSSSLAGGDQFPLFSVFYADVGDVGFDCYGHFFLRVGSGRAYPKEIWDFSEATKVIMPDGTVFQ